MKKVVLIFIAFMSCSTFAIVDIQTSPDGSTEYIDSPTDKLICGTGVDGSYTYAVKSAVLKLNKQIIGDPKDPVISHTKDTNDNHFVSACVIIKH